MEETIVQMQIEPLPPPPPPQANLKRGLDEVVDAPTSVKMSKTAPKPPSSLPFSFLMGGFGFGSSRGLKSQMTRMETNMAAADWAASAASRPYSLQDLADSDRFMEAHRWFESLSLQDMKSECKMHGIPITGSKRKLLDDLCKHALLVKNGDPKRGVAPGGAVSSGEKLKPDQAGRNVAKVRRALVADLRKCLKFDKKLRNGGNKMLKAQYANCTPELFTNLFPHAGTRKKCNVTTEQLQVDKIAKDLRYGSRVCLVPGSLSAKIDENGTISMSGKYGMAF